MARQNLVDGCHSFWNRAVPHKVGNVKTTKMCQRLTDITPLRISAATVTALFCDDINFSCTEMKGLKGYIRAFFLSFAGGKFIGIKSFCQKLKFDLLHQGRYFWIGAAIRKNLRLKLISVKKRIKF
jgi:hypothetical protein